MKRSGMKNLLKIKDWFHILRRPPYGGILRMTEESRSVILTRRRRGRISKKKKELFFRFFVIRLWRIPQNDKGKK